jgi:hypothetical protein
MDNATESWIDDRQCSEEIIALALSTTDEDAYWNFIHTLRLRGGENEFWLASQLTESTNSEKCCLGARILGQLGGNDSKYVAESADILIPMLSDQDPSVVGSAVYALGHRKDERAIDALLKLVEHPEADIRQGVAFSLGGFDNDASINALIQLSSDTHDDVRDWATFSLGSLTEIDTPTLRAALFARTNEDDGEIRGEALVGLARRNDPRALDLVRAELRRDYAGSWVLEAAELVGDVSLLPLLVALRENWGEKNEEWFKKDLNEALEACASGHEP